MRNSLYDALEVNSSSSTHAIQVALRTVVRRFWAVPRDASGDSEEAVRFAALAAAILVDPVRRKDYDAALNPGVGAGPWRLPIAGRQGGEALAEGGTHSRIFADDPAEGNEVSQLTIEAAVPKALPGVDALADPLPDGTSWASPLVWVGFFASCLLLWYGVSRPFAEGFELSWGTALLIALCASALAYAFAAWMSRSQEVAGAAASLSRLAIIKWRREGSIFIGVPLPQHDTAWIFKLRLMELTRSASGFVTAASPWRRLAARMIDYALIAIVLYLATYGVDQIVPMFDEAFILARSVLILPTLVVLLAIPASALFHRLFGTTPGKWLFSLQLVTGVTRPADHTEPTERKLLWSRASRAAWTGAALGFWPIALWRLPRNLRLARDTETDWEGNGDSVVMARPLTAPAFATGVVILLATTLILLSGWWRDYLTAQSYAATFAASAQAKFSGVLSSSLPKSAPDASVLPTVGDVAVTESPQTAAPVQVVAPRQTLSPEPAPKQVAPALTPAPNVGPEANMAKQANAAQARRVRIDAYAKQAEAARRSGNYGAIVGNCQRWTEEQPGNGEAWRCYGLAQFQSGAGRGALPALRQALKLEPRDSQVEAAILNILRP
jgi:uncharacterized RDD family membrane protein YckC